MGRWGATPGAETNWRCADFAEQTAAFVKGIERGHVVFGWEGDINEGFKDNIAPAHVAWFLQYLGKIADADIRSALVDAGAWGPEARLLHVGASGAHQPVAGRRALIAFGAGTPGALMIVKTRIRGGRARSGHRG